MEADDTSNPRVDVLIEERVTLLTYIRKVSTATNVVPINYGQAAKYNDYVITPASTVSASLFDPSPAAAKYSFFLTRVPSRLKSACCCRTSVNNLDINDPIYVDPGTHAGVLDDQITPSHDVRSTSSLYITPP
jgi:hypothetical protein